MSAENCDREVTKGIHDGEYQLVFISPESIISNLYWREMLRTPVYQENLVAFAVDEAHCVSKWLVFDLRGYYMVIKYLCVNFIIALSQLHSSCRGSFFRKEFSRLGEVRSLIPQHVHMIALTATATVSTRNKVIATLGMVDPFVLSISPHKPNITYWVTEKKPLEVTFTPLMEKLQTERCHMSRAIIFCQRYDKCAALYEMFRITLGKEFTEPIGAPNVSRFRLVDMYTNPTHSTVKDTIVSYFCKAHSNLRIVICTVAFGLGVNSPDVRQVIHWGPPADIEEYMQQTGRAGRDGELASALLFVTSSDLNNTKDHRLVDYCKNTDTCRRKMLLQHFDQVDFQKDCTGCKCCDVCAVDCKCSNCACSTFPMLMC